MIKRYGPEDFCPERKQEQSLQCVKQWLLMHRSTRRCSLIQLFEFRRFTDVKYAHVNVIGTLPSGLLLFLVKAAVMMLCGFLFILRWVVMTQMTEGALLVISQSYCAQRLKFYILLDSILFSERVGLNVQQEYLITCWIIVCKMFLLAIITQAAQWLGCLKRSSVCVCVCEQRAHLWTDSVLPQTGVTAQHTL